MQPHPIKPLAPRRSRSAQARVDEEARKTMAAFLQAAEELAGSSEEDSKEDYNGGLTSYASAAVVTGEAPTGAPEVVLEDKPTGPRMHDGGGRGGGGGEAGAGGRGRGAGRQDGFVSDLPLFPLYFPPIFLHFALIFLRLSGQQWSSWAHIWSHRY